MVLVAFLAALLAASEVATNTGKAHAGDNQLSAWPAEAPHLASFDLFWPTQTRGQFPVISAFNLATGKPEALAPKIAQVYSMPQITADPDGNIFTFPCNHQGDCIGVYEYRNERQVRAIWKGIFRPFTMIAQNHKLYVGNANNSVTIYKDLGAKLSLRITKGIDQPSSIAVDDGGDLYVLNSAPSNVSAYRAGQDSPFETITIGIASPQSIASDAFGTLYVLNAHGRVTEYSIGDTNPKRTVPRFCNRFDDEAFMAVAHDGTLFEHCTSSSGIFVFSRGRTRPDYVIPGFGVTQMIAGPYGTLAVVFGPGVNLEVYSYGSPTASWGLGEFEAGSVGIGRAW